MEKITLQARLAPWAESWTETRPGQIDMVVPEENLLTVVLTLLDVRWGYLVAITGLDLGPAENRLEILYHFCHGADCLTLRVPGPTAGAHIPSLSPIIPLAAFYERELREMLGIRVEGLLAPDHLYLPDNWPANLYPLRKDAILPQTAEAT